MPVVKDKQPALKPQDLFVSLKVAVNRRRDFTLTDLASELYMAISAVHGCVQRSEQARLLNRSAGSIRANRLGLSEFVIHGVRYAFPGLLGALTRGIPTAIGGPVLRTSFENADSLAPVWPDPEGIAFGPSLLPLYPTVPAACKKDQPLFEVMTLIDALRVGAARERELAVLELEQRLK